MLSSISPRASPKSQILAVLSGKMRMFPDLMSRCTTWRHRARLGVRWRWARCRRGGTRAWGRPCGAPSPPFPYLSPYRSPYCMPVAPRHHKPCSGAGSLYPLPPPSLLLPLPVSLLYTHSLPP